MMSRLERMHKIEKIRQHCIKELGPDHEWERYVRKNPENAAEVLEDVPVHLCDILACLWAKGGMGHNTRMFATVGGDLVFPGSDVCWDLFADNITKQTDECIEFIHQKLCV